MTRRITTLIVAAAVVTALSAPIMAETNAPAQPSTVEKIKTMSKKEWAKLVAEWTKNKDKYKVCRDKAKADGLKGRKRWASIYDCKTM
jgi:hypothetical protein